MSCRMRVAALVGLVCVGATIAALAIAVILMRHDATGARSKTHIITNGNCVT